MEYNIIDEINNLDLETELKKIDDAFDKDIENINMLEEQNIKIINQMLSKICLY
jgi:hypothetical protein